MKPEAYERTLRARAFDVARYLLPLATNTSLGQIVNARTLETQVSRLLSHPMAEIRELGAKLRDAATGPAWNVSAQAGAAFVKKLEEFEKAARVRYAGDGGRSMRIGVAGVVVEPARHRRRRQRDGEVASAPGSLAAEAAALLTREVRTAPTLVKYAEANQYLMKTRKALEQAASELLAGVPIAPAPLVDLVERTETLEVELAATLIYWASDHPYRQVRDLVAEPARGARGGDHRARPAPSRPSRRGPARFPCRSRAALRHPHGHRRLPRHAPPPPRHADQAGIHGQAGLRNADASATWAPT